MAFALPVTKIPLAALIASILPYSKENLPVQLRLELFIP
jgi:hypothetical protein